MTPWREFDCFEEKVIVNVREWKKCQIWIEKYKMERQVIK